MTMIKLEISLKAAKLCGHDAVERNSWGVLVPAEKETNYKINGIYQRKFDIFTSPADREATAIALGEKHGISIAFYREDEEWAAGWAINRYEFIAGDTLHEQHYKTYTEALAAAVEAI